jgi:YbbR domain-containing protein
MKLLKWLRGLLLDNFAWKLLSVIIAVAIWVLVASEPELGASTPARLEFRNLPDEYEIAAQSASEVSLELRGPSGVLRSIGDGARPLVILDMAGITPGEHTFPIGNANVQLNRRVHLMRAIPSEVRFEFERRMVRNVPVRARVSGEGHNGYIVAKIETQPAELTIVGPSTHVAGVEVAITDPVDVSNVVAVKEFHVNAFIGDPYVRLRSSPTVAVTVTMKKVR